MRRDNSGDIENQSDFPVSQDGGAGDTSQFLESLTERFNDNLLLTDQLVDNDANLTTFVLGDDHDGFTRIDFLTKIKKRSQRNQRNQSSPCI